MEEGGEKGLEEERRLAYVGLTRARKQAIVSAAANRRIYGNWSSSIPSRFLDELPAEHIQREGSTGMARNRVIDMPSVFTGAGGLMARKPRTIEAGAWEVQARPAHAEPLQVGDRVFHKKFGYGTVTAVDDNRVDVNFEKSDPKRVMDSFLERA
jgi:DNA helicase-2/ATP-dependent DNA helicase PcrA